jgi:TatD DNase family protein
MKEVVEAVPIERIVLETDSPYLAPEPNRGKRNTSLNLPYVADQIAKIKQLTYEQVVDITRTNAIRVYGLEEGWRY